MLDIQTKRTNLKVLVPDEAALMLAYCIDNQAHLSPWEPIREHDYLTLLYWQQHLATGLHHYRQGTEIRLAALNQSNEEVIGVCNFTGITRGAFQACFLGYSVAEKYQGQGYMTEVLTAGIQHIFGVLELHRIMANYMPSNTRSQRVLSRLGFEQEGMAKSYLNIAGQWQDHILTSKINHE